MCILCKICTVWLRLLLLQVCALALVFIVIGMFAAMIHLVVFWIGVVTLSCVVVLAVLHLSVLGWCVYFIGSFCVGVGVS